MRVIEQSHKILNLAQLKESVNLLEVAGRVCYKSECSDHDKFLRGIIAKGHESVLEHICVNMLLITDRGVSHELVRHRIASYSQESTRYCNYTSGRFDGEVTFVLPDFLTMKDLEDSNNEVAEVWRTACEISETHYKLLSGLAKKPQIARSVLNNSLKTEVFSTFNIRSLRNMLRLRTASDAHPQMQKLMKPVLKEMYENFPYLFEDIKEKIL